MISITIMIAIAVALVILLLGFYLISRSLANLSKRVDEVVKKTNQLHDRNENLQGMLRNITSAPSPMMMRMMPSPSPSPSPPSVMVASSPASLDTEILEELMELTTTSTPSQVRRLLDPDPLVIPVVQERAGVVPPAPMMETVPVPVPPTTAVGVDAEKVVERVVEEEGRVLEE